jgi:hypothetical protein
MMVAGDDLGIGGGRMEDGHRLKPAGRNPIPLFVDPCQFPSAARNGRANGASPAFYTGTPVGLMLLWQNRPEGGH